MILPQTFLVFSFEWGSIFDNMAHRQQQQFSYIRSTQNVQAKACNAPKWVSKNMLRAAHLLQALLCSWKKLYAKNAYCWLLLLLPMLCAISQNIPPQKKKKRIVGKTTSFRRVEKRTNVSRLTNCLSLVSDMLVMFNTTSGKKHYLEYEMSFCFTWPRTICLTQKRVWFYQVQYSFVWWKVASIWSIHDLYTSTN